MQIEYIETSTVDQQQAVFGCQDHFVRMIEKAFSVLIGLRESKVEIKGEDEQGVANAVSVIKSLQQIYERGEANTINQDMIPSQMAILKIQSKQWKASLRLPTAEHQLSVRLLGKKITLKP